MKHTSTLSMVALSALLTACGSSSDNNPDNSKTGDIENQYAAFEAISALI